MNEFERVLASVKVSSIEAPAQLVTIDGNDSFEESFTKLATTHLLSAPVWASGEHKYVGYLELRDLLSILLSTAQASEHNNPQSIDELLRNAREHLKVMDGITLTYMARRNPFKSVSADATLLDVIKLLAAKSATRVRRVAVVGADHKLLNVISASRCVAYFAEHSDKFGHKANATVFYLFFLLCIFFFFFLFLFGFHGLFSFSLSVLTLSFHSSRLQS
jgi:CBS domain-containing protein